jgi:hypothetical protein
MRDVFASLIMLSLLAGVVEAGFDIASMADPGDATGTAHEVHDHLGSDDSAPDSDDTEADHYCHCVTHGAALAFSLAPPKIRTESSVGTFEWTVYQSLAIPPPVPPPNA